MRRSPASKKKGGGRRGGIFLSFQPGRNGFRVFLSVSWTFYSQGRIHLEERKKGRKIPKSTIARETSGLSSLTTKWGEGDHSRERALVSPRGGGRNRVTLQKKGAQIPWLNHLKQFLTRKKGGKKEKGKCISAARLKEFVRIQGKEGKNMKLLSERERTGQR